MADQDDKYYMQMALKLASRGIGWVEPNPAVGAIIVKRGQIIGKGWHKEFGGPHAEINALEDCKTLAVSPKGATMYVTLEPCCVQGKTGPCTDAIIAAGLAKVVIAMVDPHPTASGKCIEKLRNAGIKTATGICETEAKLLNAPFIKFVKTGKPWVILKWAQSIDGKMAWVSTGQGLPTQEGVKQKWISNELSRKNVQLLRRRAQGILVGIRTVLADNPTLMTERRATRIVLDSNLRIPLDCKLLATTKKAPVLIVTSEEAIQANQNKAEQIRQMGAQILSAPAINGLRDINFLLQELSKREITLLLVEGGPRVITSFLTNQLADEICVYIAPTILGGQGSVDISGPMAELIETVRLHYVNTKRFGDDICISGLLEKTLREISVS